MMRIVSVLLMLLLGVSLTAAPKKKIRIAPGAACYVWNQDTINKPNTVPTGAFVDESTGFSSDNIHKCEELRTLRENIFIMWDGYLRIPKTGKYRFTLSVSAASRVAAKVFLNGEQVIYRMARGATAVTAQATLKKGFVKVRIYMNPANGHHFGLKFAPATGMNSTSITPGGLYHAVSDEE